MSGKLVAIGIAVIAIVAGVALYYLQVYAYYEPVELASETATGTAEIVLTTLAGTTEPMLIENFEGIDADSSPLRFRGCFTTPMSLALLTETAVAVERPIPLVAPGWFDCFDAVAIGKALEDGEALAFLGQKNIVDGIDRVIAVYPDGRAFVWHQLNEKYEQ